MTGAGGPSRYEAVVIEAEGPVVESLLASALEACAAGVCVGVVAPSSADLPTSLPEGLTAGTGVLLLAAASSPGCLVFDGTGLRVGQRDVADGQSGLGPLGWLQAELWARGVGPASTQTVDGVGAAEALRAQIELRRRGALPVVRPEPGWGLLRAGFDLDRLRVDTALFSLADGVVGTGGSPLATHAESRPWVLAGNAYVGNGADTHLLTAPVAMQLPYEMTAEPGLRRIMDLHAGLLWEDVTTTAGPLAGVRFSSLARPGTVALRAACPGPAPQPAPLAAPEEDRVVDQASDGAAVWMRVAGEAGGVVAAALDTARGTVIDRVAVYRVDADQLPDPHDAQLALKDATSAGFDRLLAEHREAWARRWADADVVLEGDPELQHAVRFSLFHLMASVPDTGEAAVGARGMSGSGYRGHVFWDADTFTLPFLAATHPAAARAMLEYRIRRLPVAQQLAHDLGRSGARFPWESARTGRDVTPTSARDRTGKVVPIRTGALEEHIVAEVAWAACCYADWTGDEEFSAGPGRELLIQTARYWASRIRVDRTGAAHIYGVIGADEYHEPVDDNAFTNVMARWNLRRAVAAADDTGGVHSPEVAPAEAAGWTALADALIDGYDPDTGVYEQFSGFHRLEPLMISEVAPRRPIAADLLLGARRVSGAQVLKQPDVLMLYHLVPDEVEADSLEPNLRFYEPRTAHGSSLSPAIHAGLLARARDYEAALELLGVASRIDLDDLTGSTAGGLHIATMGGLWQSLAFGFAGVWPRRGRLSIEPRLPPRWARLQLTVRFRGSRVVVGIEHDELVVTAERLTPVAVDGQDYDADRRGLTFRRRGGRWEVL